MSSDSWTYRPTRSAAYNVAGHNERTNRQVTDAVLACLGLDDFRIEAVADRPGHDRRYAVTTNRLATLGSVPGRPFETALEQAVQWYVDHPDWWAVDETGAQPLTPSTVISGDGTRPGDL